MLLSHGADVNAQTKDGSTPIHGPSRDGYIEIVKVQNV